MSIFVVGIFLEFYCYSETLTFFEICNSQGRKMIFKFVLVFWKIDDKTKQFES